MKKIVPALVALTILAAGFLASSAFAANIKVTPLGANDGEFCVLDRAMVFEDPDGTRILYDAGMTVAGPNDPRLGKIDGILLTHVHLDHLGSKHVPATNASECAKPKPSVNVAPDSNTEQIMRAKKAKLVVGSEMASFFAFRAKKMGGNPKDVILARYGASQMVGGVKITTVPAVHANGLIPEFLHGDHAKALADNGLTAYLGPPNGYVLTFTNGLSVYLSGDTGITAEQEVVMRRHYGAKLMVINIGDVFTTGPTEAAWVVNELVKPNEVIASHANQPSTEGGKVRAGTRMEAFIKVTKVPVRVPLSGRTMSFNEQGRCVAGC